MKIYVAGKWADKDTLRDKMTELESLGHCITHDWTSYESDFSNTKQDMADKDAQGVMDAEVVVCVMTDPSYAYRGSCSELGLAIASARNKELIAVVCPVQGMKAPCMTNVFVHHPMVDRFVSWTDFLQHLQATQALVTARKDIA
jgi:hypothetical protein